MCIIFTLKMFKKDFSHMESFKQIAWDKYMNDNLEWDYYVKNI